MSEKYPWLWWGSNKDIPHVSNVFVVSAPLPSPRRSNLAPQMKMMAMMTIISLLYHLVTPYPPFLCLLLQHIPNQPKPWRMRKISKWNKTVQNISSSKSLKTASLAHATTCYLQCMIGAEQKMKLQGNFVSSIWAFEEGRGVGRIYVANITVATCSPQGCVCSHHH